MWPMNWGTEKASHERFMAKVLLWTSQYMHFYIEHNRGHHKNVSTPNDPASARYGEVLPVFWVRSIVTGYISSWKLEAQKLEKKGHAFFSLHNEMMRMLVLQLGLIAGIWLFTGPTIAIYYLGAAIIGVLLLETVNYIEHYGLSRKEVRAGVFERTMPHHSWNSDHVVGQTYVI